MVPVMRSRRSLIAVWVVSLVAAGLAGAFVDAAGTSTDTEYFLRAAQTLLSGRWLQTFADPGLQTGPLQVAGLGGAARLAHAAGTSTSTGVATLQALVLMSLFLGAATSLARGPRRAMAVAAAATAALATAAIHGAYFYGHPAEVAIPALWVLAGGAARRRSPALAGVLVGLSAGLETWGVLGAVLLLVEPRRLVRGVVALTTTLAVLYAPFVVFGTFNMGEYHWQVHPGSVPGLLGLGPSFGWPLRLAQGAGAGLIGAVASLKLRRFQAVCWLAPLLVVWTRIALDPLGTAWYILAPQTLALLGGAHALTSGAIARRLSRRQTPEAAGGWRSPLQGGRPDSPVG